MQRQGQLWIRIFPDKPITKKPLDVRMGKGKGNPEGYVAKEALRLGAQKLPVTTKFVVSRDYDPSLNI